MSRDEEYTEVNINIRHYSNLRFAQLTIFLALTGGLVSVIFTKLTNEQATLKNCLEFAGVFTTIMFWLIEESATKKWMAFKKRGDELEKILGYKQLTEFPRSRFLSATNATRMLYIGITVFWTIVFFCSM